MAVVRVGTCDLSVAREALVEPIAVLTQWARSHGEAVVSFQEAANEGPGRALTPAGASSHG
ncbi:hypothetical protein ACFWVP_02955 [Streptomyces sp. NPDC058637]|uniref:hypothetical protein n=1 Tax=Streptomyces sp. NPDC058637 TaxID=3346569 RepID=UPI003660D145